jgi:hypothetical protein
MSDILFDLLDVVKDETTFLVFVKALAAERSKVEGLTLSSDGFQGEWANSNIQHFLEAAVSWAEDSEFGLRPGPKPANQWYLFAQFLWAGRGYE